MPALDRLKLISCVWTFETVQLLDLGVSSAVLSSVLLVLLAVLSAEFLIEV